MRPSAGGDVAIERIEASAYRIPTDAPESDGTLEWDATTLVLVEATAGDVTGIGYSYTHHAAATLVDELLGPAVVGMDAIAVPAAWAAMVRAVRNVGRPGLVATAISAVDTALWDLKARLLGLPLCDLLGSVRDGVPVYGIGAFTRVPGHGLDAALLVIPLVGSSRRPTRASSRPSRRSVTDLPATSSSTAISAPTACPAARARSSSAPSGSWKPWPTSADWTRPTSISRASSTEGTTSASSRRRSTPRAASRAATSPRP